MKYSFITSNALILHTLFIFQGNLFLHIMGIIEIEIWLIFEVLKTYEPFFLSKGKFMLLPETISSPHRTEIRYVLTCGLRGHHHKVKLGKI